MDFKVHLFHEWHPERQASGGPTEKRLIGWDVELVSEQGVKTAYFWGKGSPSRGFPKVCELVCSYCSVRGDRRKK